MNVSLDRVEDQPDARPAISLWTLHKDLSRLAEILADVAQEADAHSATPGDSASLPDPRTFFSQLLALRRARDTFFDGALFGEPAWDIMLALMIARIDKREMRLSELAALTHSTESVARDHVRALKDAQLIERYDDGDDDGDYCISLSAEAARRMAELYRAKARA